MARSPYATEIHNTPQKSGRNPSAGQPTFIILHHAATLSFDAVVNLEMGAKEVSSHLIVKDKRVASMMDEGYRAWSLSDSYWDSVSLTVETCNSAGGPGWPISADSYQTLGRIVADWCTRYGIPCNRSYVIGHREVYQRFGGSYATACPGGINLDFVVQLAQQFIAATADDDVTPIIPPKPEFGMAQRMYFARVTADGVDDGEWMLAGSDIPPHPTDPKQDGYRVTTDKETARLWARQYSFNPKDTASVQLTRDLYIKQQEFARLDAAEWRNGIKALLKP